MKNIIISLKFCGVSVAAATVLFPMISWAAITISPPSSAGVSATGASLTAQVANPWETTTVWFEWGETPALGSAVGMSSVWHQGFFYTTLSGLKSDTKYYYRAVATQGGQRVESAVMSLTTSPLEPVALKTTSHEKKEVVVKESPKETPKKEVATTTTNNSVTAVTVENRSMAAVFGVGRGIFPETLVGWIALFIALMVIALVMRLILESVEQRAPHEYARENLAEEEKYDNLKLEVPRPPQV
jgi:hypothetical protein